MVIRFSNLLRAAFLTLSISIIFGVKLGTDTENVYIRGQKVGVNVDTTDVPETTFEIDGTDGGILIPRLTISQRDGIPTPPEGLMIYNTDCKLFNFFDGTDWIPFPNLMGMEVGPITGSTSICEGATAVSYSIPDVAEATSYTWTLPDDATIGSGSGTSSITVDFGTSGGRLCVTAHTPCGSQGDCIGISLAEAAVGGTVTGGGTIDLGDPIPTLTLSGHTGDIDRWQKSLEGGGWTDIAHTSTTFSETPSVAGTWSYRAVLTSAGCPDAYSTSADVIVIAAIPDSLVYTFTGSPETWTIPGGITEIRIKAWGAQGNINSGFGNNSGAGGLGGYAEGSLSVSPGDVINIYVGGQNGYNGGATGGAGTDGDGAPGGNGGGASDVRIGGTAHVNRVIVAGGGGGAGGNSQSNGWIGGDGGTGGYANGSAGENGETPSHHAGGAGLGGTQTAGGLGGDGYVGDGLPGSLGSGGTGNDGHGTWGGGGGGGGGGYYGGGGGGGGYGGSGGGGGGGSTYIGGVTSTSTANGIRTGDGRVVITW